MGGVSLSQILLWEPGLCSASSCIHLSLCKHPIPSKLTKPRQGSGVETLCGAVTPSCSNNTRHYKPFVWSSYQQTHISNTEVEYTLNTSHEQVQEKQTNKTIVPSQSYLLLRVKLVCKLLVFFILLQVAFNRPT